MTVGSVEIDLLPVGVSWTAFALEISAVSGRKGVGDALGRLGSGFRFQIGKHIGWTSSPQLYKEHCLCRTFKIRRYMLGTLAIFG